MTKAEIKKLAGEHLSPYFDKLPVNEESLKGGGSECFYPGVTIQLDAYPVASFDATRKSYMASGGTKFEPAAGVADEAYVYEQDAGKSSHVVGVFAKAGQHVLTISMDVNASQTAQSLRPAVIALTKAATTKLR